MHRRRSGVLEQVDPFSFCAGSLFHMAPGIPLPRLIPDNLTAVRPPVQDFATRGGCPRPWLGGAGAASWFNVFAIVVRPCPAFDISKMRGTTSVPRTESRTSGNVGHLVFEAAGTAFGSVAALHQQHAKQKTPLWRVRPFRCELDETAEPLVLMSQTTMNRS